MKRLLACFSIICAIGCGGGGEGTLPGGPPGVGRGTLVSSSLIRDYGSLSMNTVLSYIEYQSGISLSVTSDVSLYKVVYTTIDLTGKEVQATGAVAIPDTPTNPSLVSYQHSTATSRTNVPSGNNDEGWAVLSIYAATGNYVVAMADYLGLGGGTGFHPFLNSASEASASLDMIRAARQLCTQKNVALNNKLFLNGYSQGGHATMALTQLIESLNSTEFKITATAPCAGPYDLADTELNFAFDNPSTDTPTFLAYVVLAYREIYGILFDLSQVFIAPWDKRVESLFDGSHDIDDIAKVLPSDPKKLFTATFIEQIFHTLGNNFVGKLLLNSNWEWIPKSTMTLFHASSDNVVSYQNSVRAYNYMHSKGAPVTLVDLGTGITHEDGFYYAIPKSRLWFDNLISK